MRPASSSPCLASLRPRSAVDPGRDVAAAMLQSSEAALHVTPSRSREGGGGMQDHARRSKNFSGRSHSLPARPRPRLRYASLACAAAVSPRRTAVSRALLGSAVQPEGDGNPTAPSVCHQSAPWCANNAPNSCFDIHFYIFLLEAPTSRRSVSVDWSSRRCRCSTRLPLCLWRGGRGALRHVAVARSPLWLRLLRVLLLWIRAEP